MTNVRFEKQLCNKARLVKDVAGKMAHISSRLSLQCGLHLCKKARLVKDVAGKMAHISSRLPLQCSLHLCKKARLVKDVAGKMVHVLSRLSLQCGLHLHSQLFTMFDWVSKALLTNDYFIDVEVWCLLPYKCALSYTFVQIALPSLNLWTLLQLTLFP